ncbi:hypothetical protein BKK81_10105 [Cupriavidus sp. USMAHM13]|uniref:hypothetical protein n=1 Tax=Cupriavidus sp. USMAHM13 TaxID=1389192 RepID=UPI0008A69710|nr:hypothetical protein [Cupriavidus sp. USMAHM13]AOY99577.1 hypothetical protein BKK81_10105 [Cupriavidus sp. USMAHM13]
MALSRPLAPHERALLDFLIETCEPLDGKRTSQWQTQIKTCRVREIGDPYYLAVVHDEETEKSGCDAITLGRDLIALDQGIPVLIYAILMKTPTDYLIDIFDIDRMDGRPLTAYPKPGNTLMIMEEGKRVGGADWRHAYPEYDRPPPRKLI